LLRLYRWLRQWLKGRLSPRSCGGLRKPEIIHPHFSQMWLSYSTYCCSIQMGLDTVKSTGHCFQPGDHAFLKVSTYCMKPL
jgi:hypothetical protein